MERFLNLIPDITVLDIGDLRLTVFDNNLPEEKGLLPHSHSFFEFQYIKEGSISLKTNSSKHIANAGSYALIPPGIFHFTEYEKEDFNRFCLLFSIDFAEKSESSFSEYRYYSAIMKMPDKITERKNKAISECVESIINLKSESIPKNEHKLKIALSALFILIAEDVEKNYSVDHTKKELFYSITTKKQKLHGIIGEYLSLHFSENSLISSLSETLHMSERNTARIVKDLFGKSLSALILEKRMNCAMGYITETDTPLNKIAEISGYNSYNSFYKAFKQYYGFTPEKPRENRTI